MRNVLLFPGALGDVVLWAPAVTALAQRVPVEVSVQRSVCAIAGGLMPVVVGPPFDGAVMRSLFADGSLEPSLATWLRGADVHAWIGRHRDDVEAGLAAAGVGHVQWHAVHRGDGAQHVGLAYAADLGIDVPTAPPTLRLSSPVPPPSWDKEPAARLVLHPGAGARAKRWPGDRVLALADAWHERGGEVTVLCGPAEHDLVRCWRESSHRVVADVDLAVAVALIASAPLYVGNDSGISHLAGALARSGVVLFGPTGSARWSPRGGHLRALSFDATVHDIVSVLGEMTRAGRLDTSSHQH